MAVHSNLKLVDCDDDGVDLAFRKDVLRGLAQEPKAIPARWLYDHAGSELFEAITALPEYHPTRAEIGLLERCGEDLARLVGEGRAVVEFGSGSSLKTPLLLRRIAPAAYVPIDISGEFLSESSAQLAAAFPDLPVTPVEADFTKPVRIPSQPGGTDKLGFFPGSTIGNMVPASAVDLLRSMRQTLGATGQLLIGFDGVKPVAELVAAYDDAQGITARFNLNLLHRINRELDGDIPVDAFRHEARWNEMWNRIEMHLRAIRPVAFSVDGERFEVAEGETIHTENSHKYLPAQARLLLQAGGWTPVAQWDDDTHKFHVILAEATPTRFAP